MTRLTVGNIWTTVSGDYDEDTIDKATRFRPDGFKFSQEYISGRWDGFTHLFQPGRRKFPTGLVKRVKQALEADGYKVQIDDQRERRGLKLTTAVSLKDISLRDAQQGMVDAVIRRQRGIIDACTGAGKTEVAAGIIEALQVPTLMVVPSKALLGQTADRLAQRFGLNKEDIGRIGDGVWWPREITVATFQTLSRRLEGGLTATARKKLDLWLSKGVISEGDYHLELDRSAERQLARKETLELLKGFDLLILDEAHHATTAKEWAKVIEGSPAFYRVGLSATPFKEPVQSGLRLVGFTADVAYSYELADAIEDGHAVQPHCFMIRYRGPEEEGQYSYGYLYENLIVENEVRNDAIIELGLEAENNHLPTIILVERIGHGEKLAAALGWPFVNGGWSSADRKKTLDAINAGRVPGAISTVLSEGIDVPNLAMLILAGGGKAKHLVVQRVGRVTRKGTFPFCLVFDFYDDGHTMLVRQTKRRRSAITKDLGFKVTTLAKVPDLASILKDIDPDWELKKPA